MNDVTSFDITAMYMSDIILIHGEAENANTGEMYLGPCYIPAKTEHLLLLPGKTDKHVILIVPRDTTLTANIMDKDNQTAKLAKIGAGESHASMVAVHQLQATHKESMSALHNFNKNAAEYTSAECSDRGCHSPEMGQATDLCLYHASKHRTELETRISHHKALKDKSEHALTTSVSNLLHRKKAGPHDDHILEQVLTQEVLEHKQICDEEGPAKEPSKKTSLKKKKATVAPEPLEAIPAAETAPAEQQSKIAPDLQVQEKSKHVMPSVENPSYHMVNKDDDSAKEQSSASSSTANA